MTVQQDAVQAITEEFLLASTTTAIVVFGSAAVGEEKPTSDVDIEIITSKTVPYTLDQKREVHGVKVDLEIISLADFQRWIREYPYLWYDYLLRHRIIYDPSGVIKNAIESLRDYFSNHPETVAFWEEKLSKMKEAKRNGIHPENCFRVCDEAETKFSKHKKVTRDFFRD